MLYLTAISISKRKKKPFVNNNKTNSYHNAFNFLHIAIKCIKSIFVSY